MCGDDVVQSAAPAPITDSIQHQSFENAAMSESINDA